MASQVCEKTLLVQDILHEARRRYFTKHGEMFSAEDMAKLATSLAKVEAKVRRDVLCNPKVFLQTLLNGDLILVPYPFTYKSIVKLHKFYNISRLVNFY